MQRINADNASSYLRQAEWISRDEVVTVSELAGGVSNVVLLVKRQAASDFVLKQARGKLRVAQPWFCSVERIRREVAVLRLCERILTAAPGRSTGSHHDDTPKVVTPRVLFEDAKNFVFAMTAAPPHAVWKHQLLAGNTDAAVAVACGKLLARLHGETWRDATIARDFSDRQFFDDLRVDPYYRRVAQVHPELRPHINDLIDSLDQNAVALVHADFSPKNLLVGDDGSLTLVDFEVGHFGDPAFDLGFFLTHLALKAFHAGANSEAYWFLADQFWSAYVAGLAPAVAAAERTHLERRAVRNLAACLLARIDGKSPVEYLTERRRDAVRQAAVELVAGCPDDWPAVRSQLHARFR